MKIEIKLNSKELEMLENVFKPINVFAKEIASTDSEDMTETFNMIKRNATAGYTADHKAYTCVLKKEDEEYVVSWDLKNLFIEIVSEFGNKITKLFVNIARPIIELAQDKIISKLNELSDEKEVTAIVGGKSLSCSKAWMSNKSIEHEKAILFDFKEYIEMHADDDKNKLIDDINMMLMNNLTVVKHNKEFFKKLINDLDIDKDKLNSLIEMI